MKKGKVFNSKILCCPECRKRFSTFKAVNTHLAIKHDADYAIIPPGNATTKPMPKRRIVQKLTPLVVN